MLFPDITINKVGTWRNPQKIAVTKLNFVDHYVLEYHLDTGTTILNGVSCEYHPGTFILIRPGDLRYSLLDAEATRSQFIKFQIVDDPSTKLEPLLNHIQTSTEATEECKILWKTFRNLYKQNENSFQYITVLVSLFVLLSGDVPNPVIAESSLHQQALFKAVCYMREHLTENITVTDIATHIGYSTTHFNHLFQLYVKDTPYSYYNSLKIEKAKQLLINSTWSISEISEFLAYSTASKFIRAFKRECNVTPGQFRRDPNAYMTDIG